MAFLTGVAFDDVMVADEDSLLELVSHLPSESSRSLLELARLAATAEAEPVQLVLISRSVHPDAQRRFRVHE